MKKILVLLLAVLMMLSATAGLAEGIEEGEKYLRVSLYSYPTDLEPTNGYYGWSLTRMGIGETLVKFDVDLNCVPWLAESWEQVDDETWVFHIREGVTFHNGNALTAQIAMESIQRSVDMNTRAANIANIKSIRFLSVGITTVSRFLTSH